MRKNATKQGFSLIEIIVAFSVLVVVIVASTNLLVTIIRTNTENQNTLVAYGLAQEGLEAVRNIRDSNWLLGADFQGKVGSDCLWAGGVCLPDTVGITKDFSIEVQMVQFGGDANPGVQSIPLYSPWKLQDVSAIASEPSVESTQLCFAEGWYMPCGNLGQENKSLFSRYVEISVVTDKKYRVSSVVRWLESGRKKEVRLSTELTDWKGGNT